MRDQFLIMCHYYVIQSPPVAYWNKLRKMKTTCQMASLLEQIREGLLELQNH